MIWAFITRASDIALCAVQKWWRPVTCITVTASIGINGVWIPFQRGEVVDLVGLSALIASLTPFIAARTWEKMKLEKVE